MIRQKTSTTYTEEKTIPVPKKIPVLLHNGSAYDWHFIMKYLPEEIKGDFECLGKNTEKYITFSIPIKKEVNNDDDGDKKKKRKKNHTQTKLYW